MACNGLSSWLPEIQSVFINPVCNGFVVGICGKDYIARSMREALRLVAKHYRKKGSK